ncbi:MAG: ATP-binding protein [Bacillus subtilis]|nr:ATP-binding protein [Bacillus subtilis]
MTDNGIGMTYDEVVENLGTIAKSGTLEFLQNLKGKEVGEVDLIGQFGVGFYSAFMVAKKVEVRTKSPYSEKAYLWTSEGEDEFTVEEIKKDDRGTEITVYLRDNEDEEKFDEYLDEYKIEGLRQKVLGLRQVSDYDGKRRRKTQTR